MWVCIDLCVWEYCTVNFVHILSGQEFACARLKHGSGSTPLFRVASSFNWCDLTLIDGMTGCLSGGAWSLSCMSW